MNLGPVPQNMIQRAKTLLLQPQIEWRAIDAEPMTLGGIYKGWVAPLAAIGPVAGLIGNLLFSLSIFRIFSFPGILIGAISGAILSYALSFASVFVMALVIDALAPSFGAQKNQIQATKIAAFSMTAAWIAGAFLILPPLWPLVMLAGLYGYYLLFIGLPILMRPPQNQAATYAIVSIVVAFVMLAVVNLLIRIPTFFF